LVNIARKQQQQNMRRQDDRELKLEFDPFAEKEWKARGKVVPKGDKKMKTSKLDGGGFATTYHKKLLPGVVAQARDGITRFAVNVVDREKIVNLGITEKDV